MKLPLAWLADHVDHGLAPRALAERLDLTGTEVARVLHYGVGGDGEHFVVGRVLSAEQHPDADRLKVCAVDVGEAEPSTIVCGAPNVAAGQAVAVARPGAVMPDGTKLKAAKLRGVRSEGMILAEDELAIGEDHDGILVLDGQAADAAPGTPLAEFVPGLSDAVLDLEITPNRPDCLGVLGLALEVGAATGAPVRRLGWHDAPHVQGDGEAPIAVVVEDEELCPRFTAQAYADVRIGPSPLWLKARLSAAGQRPINNVVDITNYVMLLTGNPLHAFDADRIAGGRLTVRRARDGEQLETLDGRTRKLVAGDGLILDADGPTSLAGVMGGARSEVSPNTTNVLMEVAVWDGPTLHATAARLDLRSEASARLEKSLPPEGALEAQAIAGHLLRELCGARPVGPLVDVGTPGPQQPPVIRLRETRVERLLGVAVPRERQRAVLEALGFGVADAEDGLDVAVPPRRRADVTREADVIEEIARLAVLEELPATLPARRGGAGQVPLALRLRRRAEDVLVGAGLHEIAGWSFTSRERLATLDLADPAVVALENPMSEDESVLRPTVLGSLLDAAQRNRARGHERLALWESGAVYRPWKDGSGHATPADEHIALAALLSGPVRPPSWSEPRAPQADVFAALALVEAVGSALRLGLEVRPAPEGLWPFLHPGRSGEVLLDGARVGFAGEVHPRVAARFDLEQVAAFALDAGRLAAAAEQVAVPAYADVTAFPPVRQDLAVWTTAPAADVLAAARGAAGALLRHAEVFDVFDASDGRRSLALRLTFAAADRTLTEEEASAARQRIAAALVEQGLGEPRT